MATPPIPGTSPIVPVRDTARTLAFFRDCLGFEQVLGNPDHGYALVRRGPAMIAFIQAADDEVLKATANNISAQIWVEDLDGLWAEIEPKIPDHADGSFRAPFDRDYGVREFHVKDPDGFLMFFTQLDPA